MSSPHLQLQQGVDALLRDYAQISPEESAIVAYTPDSRRAAAHLLLGLDRFGVTYESIVMQPLIDPTFGPTLAASVDRIGSGHPIVLFTLELETMSHFDQIIETMQRVGEQAFRSYRMISASDELFSLAYNMTPEDLSRRNSQVLAALSGQHRLTVTTAAGTNLSIEVDDAKYDWLSNRGYWRPGALVILPAGEVATYPVTVNGTLIADGAINCNIITRLDMRLKANPLTIAISDSRAVRHHTDDPDLQEMVTLAFNRPNCRRIGELGFGTNQGITEFISLNSHINERRPGLHLGFGQHNQDYARVPYLEELHMDVITDDATVAVDGGPTFVMSELKGIDAPHPPLVRDEDIVGDCCGLPYANLIVDAQ